MTKTTLAVERLGADSAAWDRFVRDTPGSSYCQLSGWRDVIGGSLGHECVMLVARNGGGVVAGVLPLVRVRSRIFGHYLISMAFLNGGGGCGSPEARLALVEAAVEEARRSGVRLLELRGREEAPAPLQRSSRKITVVLPLPATPDELLKSFHSKIRANIKKPVREGMEMRYGADQVEPFYRVYALNMRDLGTPVLPLRFFEAIARQFPDVVLFGVLWAGAKPVCGQCAFVWGDTLEMVWGSADRDYNKFKVTTYVHWVFMEHAIRKGLRTFDFGRCTEGSGTHQFKKQWGGSDVPLPWGIWSPSGVVSPPSPDKPLFKIATRAWQRLPLPVANKLGPLISPGLP